MIKRGLGKKALEMVFSTWVAMVLAIMVLLFLILFFTGASKGFLENVESYFRYSNVDSVIKGCNILANSESKYGFCCERKIVKYYLDKEKISSEFSCNELVDKDFINGEIKELDCREVKCS